MPDKSSYVGLTQEQIDEIEKLRPADSSTPWYRVIPQSDIPSVFPQSFKDKMDHAVVMGSGDNTGRTFVVINAQRVDAKDNAIDQEPFGVVLDTGTTDTSGVFIHHGNWGGRTEKASIPPQFWEHVRESGIGNCYPPPSLRPGDSGKLESLDTNSNMGAFNKTISNLIDLECL